MKKINQRLQDSIGANFIEGEGDIRFLLSPSDMGVRRNLGRPGARFAPECILYQFKKMNSHFDSLRFSEHIVSSQKEEKIDFHKAQDQSSEAIEKKIENFKFIHIGGGHDHVYPLLKTLDSKLKHQKEFENIVIVNIDAHLDTRVDEQRHSGTPFRNFDEKANLPFYLYQYGIHQFANSKSTHQALNRNKMHINYFKHNHFDKINFLKDLKENCPFEINNKTLLLISLDCDALHASIMQGVSAVNHNGLTLDHCVQLINTLSELRLKTIFGIYEYNPLLDNLSTSGARAISFLINNFIQKFYL